MEATNQTTNEIKRTDKQSAPKTTDKQPEKVESWVTAAIDVLESAAEILVLADVPGVAADDLSINLDKEVLTFVGKRKNASWAYKRSFVIPRDFDFDAISAELDAGVLKLHIPRRASTRARQIPVRGT